MFFARESGNVIDYEIPISGNLKKPKFHFKDVILDALKNSVVKPVTSPYRYEVKSLENNIEKKIGFNWEHGSLDMVCDQEQYVKRVADFLHNNPEAKITVFPNYYEERELEYIAFYEAKKKYYLLSNKKNKRDYDEEDSTQVLRMSPKDSLFTVYMRRSLRDTVSRTSQQLTRAFVGADLVARKYETLNSARKNKFLSYFADAGVKERLRFEKSADVIPFNGFSFYQVSYDGKIPESMKEAFEELKEFDNERPRVEVKEKREKTRRFFKARR